MSESWKNKSQSISALNMDNFYDFCVEYSKYAFSMAFKAVMKPSPAIELAASALSRVICVESAENGSAMPEDAIRKALRSFLNKEQADRLLNDSVNIDSSDIYNTTVEDKILDLALEKAQRDIPRYAPVYSGTSGTFLILGIVLAIVAAIIFIWTNPFAKGLIEQDTSGSDVLLSEPSARLNSALLIDVSSEIGAADTDNLISIPVIFTITGADARGDLGLSVRGNDGTVCDIYQLTGNSYCFAAAKNQMYKLSVTNASGDCVTHYFNVYQLNSSIGNPFSSGCCAIKCSGSSSVDLFSAAADAQGISPIGTVGENGETIHSGTLRITRLPESCTAALSADKRMIEFTSGGTTGVDSIGLELIGDDGKSTRLSVPVIIADNAPTLNDECRDITLTHTPSSAGCIVGKLSATDPDGDPVSYSLGDAVNCSVTLSKNGTYLLRVAPDFSGSEAQFTVSANDGFIDSDPLAVHIHLKNDLITTDHFSGKVVCLTSGSGYYTFPLPEKDDNGDPLTWSIASPENGSTDYAGISIAGNALRYALNSDINAAFDDKVYVTCSDGWLTSEPIAVNIKGLRNLPPKLVNGTNDIYITKDTGSIDISISLTNDHEEDSCAIEEITKCVGGAVRKTDSWRDLIFTFTPDGSSDECTVEVRVRENGNGNTAVFTYHIFIQ